MEYYENKYKETLEKAREQLEGAKVFDYKDEQIAHDIRTTIYEIFPELKESEDDRIRKELLNHLKEASYGKTLVVSTLDYKRWADWLEKQGDQKAEQEIEPFEAEHGKYYYCIKDYFCGGRKQASKGDVIQALRGMSIMGLKDASEYFLPVNFIKCNSDWSEEDEKILRILIEGFEDYSEPDREWWKGLKVKECTKWLKSLKERVQAKQEWSDEDESRINNLCHFLEEYGNQYYGGLTLKDTISWLKSLRPKNGWKPSDEQMNIMQYLCAISSHPNPNVMPIMESLYNDLKKLREE